MADRIRAAAEVKVTPDVRLTPEEKENIGPILARLYPGGDFIVHAMDDYRVEWKDAREFPTVEVVKAEYQKILQEKADRDLRDLSRKTHIEILRSLRGKDLNSEEIKQAVRSVLEVL